MAEHPYISIDEAKTMFGPPDGPGANITNWGQNYCGHNVHVHHPKTYEEVAGLVKALAAQGAKVRALGVMHSWSNVFADDGTHVIFLDNFKTIAQAPNDYTLVTLQVRGSGLLFSLLLPVPFFVKFALHLLKRCFCGRSFLSSPCAPANPNLSLPPFLSFLQAGVTNAELADFADSENRGYGRFSYLPGNTLVQVRHQQQREGRGEVYLN